ncbi:hypothetical protein ASD86_18740 [Lysobacter sp. Root690]|nr:hypothetical protein ASD86_18740 [Lysobacter sp. Root690]
MQPSCTVALRIVGRELEHRASPRWVAIDKFLGSHQPMMLRNRNIIDFSQLHMRTRTAHKTP